LIEEEDSDLCSQNPRLKEIIKEKEADIHVLSLDLERDKWIINFLEKENKQLINKQDLLELQIIKENQQKSKRAKGKMTSIEKDNDQEYLLEKMNSNLEKLLDKENKEKNMLRHMAYHYLVQSKICKTMIRYLKAMLRRALKAKKEQDKLRILGEASLAQKSS